MRGFPWGGTYSSHRAVEGKSQDFLNGLRDDMEKPKLELLGRVAALWFWPCGGFVRDGMRVVTL